MLLKVITTIKDSSHVSSIQDREPSSSKEGYKVIALAKIKLENNVAYLNDIILGTCILCGFDYGKVSQDAPLFFQHV